jgi:hypothetical protein
MNKQDVEYLRGTLIKATEIDSYELPFQSVVKVFIRNREQWAMARAHKIPIYREDVHELASGHQYKRLYILLTFEQIIAAADNIYNK